VQWPLLRTLGRALGVRATDSLLWRAAEFLVAAFARVAEEDVFAPLPLRRHPRHVVLILPSVILIFTVWHLEVCVTKLTFWRMAGYQTCGDLATVKIPGRDSTLCFWLL
jgi:hypothetical protein